MVPMSLQKLPSIGALEAFLVVAERQSLKAAAPELNISISALSRRIQTLETQLGLMLFERGARSLRLTEDGHALRDSVCTSFESLQSSMAVLSRRQARPRLRIGAPAGLTGYWLTPRLAAFKAAHPAIEISAETSDLVLSRLGSGLDALILVMEDDGPPIGDRYELQRLAPVRIQAVCSPGLEASLARPADLTDQVVLTPRGHADWLDCWIRAAGGAGTPRRVEPFDSMPVLLEAAANGLGVGLVHELMAAAQIESGRLVDPFAVRARTGSSYVLVARAADAEAPAFQRFRAWLGGQMAPDRARLD